MRQKIEAAIKILQGQGHTVRPQSREGTLWFEINGKMLASWKEMEELADGVYSLSELEELFVRRRSEKEGKL